MKTPVNHAPNYTPAESRPDYRGKETLIPRPSGAILAADPRGPVELIKRAGKKFAVVYGLQVKDGLTRDQAATEYGNCLFHAIECEGLT